MKVGELMTESVSALTSDMSLAEAARIMQRENLGALPVAADGFLIGMLTDRDITTRCVAAGQDPASVAVGEICTKGAVWISPEHSVTEAARRMARTKVRRLPVLKQGRLVGMISLADIARARNYFAEKKRKIKNRTDSLRNRSFFYFSRSPFYRTACVIC